MAGSRRSLNQSGAPSSTASRTQCQAVSRCEPLMAKAVRRTSPGTSLAPSLSCLAARSGPTRMRPARGTAAVVSAPVKADYPGRSLPTAGCSRLATESRSWLPPAGCSRLPPGGRSLPTARAGLIAAAAGPAGQRDRHLGAGLHGGGEDRLHPARQRDPERDLHRFERQAAFGGRRPGLLVQYRCDPLRGHADLLGDGLGAGPDRLLAPLDERDPPVSVRLPGAADDVVETC